MLICSFRVINAVKSFVEALGDEVDNFLRDFVKLFLLSFRLFEGRDLKGLGKFLLLLLGLLLLLLFVVHLYLELSGNLAVAEGVEGLALHELTWNDRLLEGGKLKSLSHLLVLITGQCIRDQFLLSVTQRHNLADRLRLLCLKGRYF